MAGPSQRPPFGTDTRLPTGLAGATCGALAPLLLLLGCTTPAEEAAADRQHARNLEQGLWWVRVATDADGRSYSILNRDMRPGRDQVREVWIQRADGGAPVRVRHFRWRFDCRARTAQLLAEGIERRDGSFDPIRTFDGPARARGAQAFDEVLLVEACRGAGQEVRPFD